jgi:hypothetical protein
VRRFRITKKKEWKNIRKLERWTEQQEKMGKYKCHNQIRKPT